MKKILLLLCLLLCLTACTEKKEEPGTVVVPADPDPVEEGTPLTDAYRAEMDEYEVLEIMVLGTIEDDDGLADVLNRAEKEGYHLIKEIANDHIIHGKHSTVDGDLVYLLIPKEGLTLSLGSYDPLTNKASEVYFKEENALPVIYIESAAYMTPQGIIELDQDDLKMRMLTGINGQGELRTAFLMGIVDMTSYEKLDLTAYGEILKKDLEENAPVAADDILNNEYMALAMDEMLYEGKMYLIYSMENYTGLPNYLYGIHYDSEKNETRYIISYDHESWTAVFETTE